MFETGKVSFTRHMAKQGFDKPRLWYIHVYLGFYSVSTLLGPLTMAEYRK